MNQFAFWEALSDINNWLKRSGDKVTWWRLQKHPEQELNTTLETRGKVDRFERQVTKLAEESEGAKDTQVRGSLHPGHRRGVSVLDMPILRQTLVGHL